MEDEVSAEALAQEEAAFSDGFNAVETKTERPAPESKPAEPEAKPANEPVAQEPAKEPEQAPVAALTPQEITELRAAAQAIPGMQTKLREAYGRIGALNDLLHKKSEEKKADGQPAALSRLEMKRIKEAYPELADDLTADIGDALASLKTTAQDPAEMERLIADRVALASLELRKEALAERHPDWEDVKKSDVFWKWMGELPADEAKAIQTSASPMFIASKLDTFKTWRDKASKAKEKSQERLTAAIAPTGGSSAGKSTLSDDEAMQKAFAEGFNS